MKGSKVITVTYDWKPSACTHCKVFGHEFKVCNKRPRTAEEEEERLRKEEELKSKAKKIDAEFEVQGRKRNNGNV